MKTARHLSIILAIALLLLGIFARAEILQVFSDSKDVKQVKLLFKPTIEKLSYDGAVVIDALQLPAFELGSISPSGSKWEEKKLMQLSEYLKLHNEKVVQIDGAYVQDEQSIQIGGYANFGHARAGVLKNILISNGVSSQRILTKGFLTSDPEDTKPFKFLLMNDSPQIP